MGGGDKVGDDLVHACAVESDGEWVGFVEADRGGGTGLPATFRGRNGASLLPWNGHAGLAAGVSELGASVGAVLVEEVRDALEFGDVLVFPDSEVSRRDAAFGVDRVGLCDDEAGTADGAAAEMDQVPVAGEAIDAGVFAHGGDGDTVWHSEAAEFKRGEEMVHGLGHNTLDVAGEIWTDGLNFEWCLIGILRELQDFSWFFCGEVVVKCVVNVVRG